MQVKQTLKRWRDAYVSAQVARAKIPQFPPDTLCRCRITFQGRVQKVGFRQEVREMAQRLELTGFCRNLSDGSVLTEIQGPKNRIQYLTAFMSSLKRIRIRRILRQEIPMVPAEKDFVQK